MDTNLFFKHQAQTTPFPKALKIKKAYGSFIEDYSGKKYIDLVSGVSANTLGHNHPKIIEAIKNQISNYMHVMVYGEYIQSPQYNLALLLSKQLTKDLNCTYFVNSGCEAIEGAMKLAKRVTGKNEFISCNDSYHGSTHGTLSIMGNEYYKQKYRPLLPECNKINYNDFNDINKISSKTAGVIIEPIQGATGFVKSNKKWLKKIRERCNETGSILIFDEIQSCFGRTGKLFAFQEYNVTPDVLCIAKGMGGGMPIGAFISSHKKMNLLKINPELGHITTFGGHPVNCAASLATLKILINEKNIIKTIKDKEIMIRKMLNHPSILEIRGCGLMLGVELGCSEKCKKFVDEAYNEGLITFFFLFNKSSVRLSPPLTISFDEIEFACKKFIKVLNKIKT
tara:strand:+ start:373 stop:1560 length:1188 start_codon:yes stop_codon:yes gene_type:complete